MKLLDKNDLKPLFEARPGQRDYTLGRYFNFWQKIPYRARFKMVLKLLPRKKAANFLDIGFGSGIFIPELCQRSENFYGMDIHPEINLVNKIIAQKKMRANLLQADIKKGLPYPDNFFDVVLCLSVLEFITDTGWALDEIRRVARPSATIIIGAPVLNPLTNFMYKNILKFKNHSAVHRANHQKIINLAKQKMKVAKIMHYPFWLPLNFSAFFILKAIK